MSKFHIIVDISNITAEQAQEFRRLFAWMNYCGMAGCSRSAKVKVTESLGTIDGLSFDFE